MSSTPTSRSGSVPLWTLASTLAVVCLPASASVIGSHVLNGDGTTTYSYLIDNTAGGFDVAAWSLEFAFPIPDWDPFDTLSGGDVSVPNVDWLAGLGLPVLGLSAQDFLSLTPAGDVPAGGSLAGFSFTSAYPPGSVTYFEFSASGESATGTTLGPVPPTPVPDGGPAIEGLGLAFLTGLGAIHRRRNASGRD